MKHPAAVILIALLALATGRASAQDVRKAVRAGQFYEADPAALAAEIDSDLAAAPAPIAAASRIRALVVPHAGYAYSAKTAARAYRQVQGRDISAVVILGPSHYVGFEGGSIFSGDGFETPLGVAAVDTAAARALIKATGFTYVAAAHAEEHSLEVQVPFIQKALPRAKIVPVVMGVPSDRTIRTLAAALGKVFKDKDVLVVASTDMSHFLAKREANALDAETVTLVRDMKVPALIRKLERNENILCGGAAVAAALLYAQGLGDAAVEILGYADSTEGGGPSDRVVGYFAAAVTAGAPGATTAAPQGGAAGAPGATMAAPADFALTAEDKKDLLALARRAVELYVREGKVLDAATDRPNLRTPRGAFVTLSEAGALRGCIGFTEPVAPLAETVIRAGIYAATEDPRFRTVSAAELKGLEYEISVLTPLHKIDASQVQVGRHGLVVAKDGRRGLLLPQVATEYRWSREEFLRQTCLKAGLPADAWRTGAEIYAFEAVVFK